MGLEIAEILAILEKLSGLVKSVAGIRAWHKALKANQYEVAALVLLADPKFQKGLAVLEAEDGPEMRALVENVKNLAAFNKALDHFYPEEKI